MEEKQLTKPQRVARDVLVMSRNSLLVNLRFLDAALNRLELRPIDESSLLTDGQYLLYNPKKVLLNFRNQKEMVTRDYLHAVMHCVCRHLFINPMIDRPLWDLACDITVESIITDSGLKITEAYRQGAQLAQINRLREQCGRLTAERIYSYFKTINISKDEAASLRALFYADNHEIWYMLPDEKYYRFGIGPKPKMLIKSEQGNQGKYSSVTQDDDVEHSGAEQIRVTADLTQEELDKEWQKIAERMKVDVESFGKQHGFHAGSLIRNLQEVTRETYDYTDFLRRFSVMGEVMKVNQDEYDYIFYKYGIDTYGNIPLIEPLEYKEEKRIKDFVIAIDSSISISEAQAQAFLQKTYNILKNTDSFFDTINLHIFQCDAAIQEHVKITNQEELDHYISIYHQRGLGGTDFRPVFEEVDKMIAEKELTNLKGIVYFTDAYGPFPERRPNYDVVVAFVVDKLEEIPPIPSWAIKVIFKGDDLWGDAV